MASFRNILIYLHHSRQQANPCPDFLDYIYLNKIRDAPNLGQGEADCLQISDDLKQIALGDILARVYNMSQTGTGEKGLGQNKLLFNKLILVFASSALCR